MLTRQLRELKKTIVSRKPYPEVPLRLEYSLTEFGRTVEPVLRLLRQWGQTYLDHAAEVRQQRAW